MVEHIRSFWHIVLDISLKYNGPIQSKTLTYKDRWHFDKATTLHSFVVPITMKLCMLSHGKFQCIRISTNMTTGYFVFGKQVC